jgi:hypothetical protein
MTQQPVYIRHRDRMVQESVHQDVADTLIACRWMAGTTSRPMWGPSTPIQGPPQVIITAPGDVMGIVSVPITMIDYFQEITEPEENVVGDPESGHTELNTLAVDDGQAGESEEMEMGSSMLEVPYRFTMAFYAESVGVAQALLNDLRDRYKGKIVAPEYIPLYDFNVDPDTEVSRLDVVDFSYLRDVETVTAADVTLFYAQLTLTDYVD